MSYYALFRGQRAFNEALKHVADMLGCMTSIEYQRPSSSLTIVGEEAAVNIVSHVWRTALKTYETTLNERVSKGSIKSREEFRQRSEDYILGFFEGLTARHSYVHPRILGLLDGMK